MSAKMYEAVKFLYDGILKEKMGPPRIQALALQTTSALNKRQQKRFREILKSMVLAEAHRLSDIYKAFDLDGVE